MGDCERKPSGPATLWESIAADVQGASNVQHASQLFCEHLYSALQESAILIRLFATLRLDALPADDRRFARDLAERENAAHLLDDSTPILTLMGTRGAGARWCDRTESRGHRAIPLLSAESVAEAPMIARLLGSIGFPLMKPETAGAHFVSLHAADADGLFYVRDAATTTDDRGRLIIPAIEFVDRYRVKCVFGFGGRYASAPAFVTAIIFTRAEMPRSTAAAYLPLIGSFKDGTRALVERGAFFPEA